MLDQATLEFEFGNHAPRCASTAIPGDRRDLSLKIAEIARSRLRASAYASVRTLQCEHHEGVLVLRGRVSSYYLKQMAQEAVRNLHGVELILNAVEVVSRNGS
jgi:osmotically-inducible protein OsmY